MIRIPRFAIRITMQNPKKMIEEIISKSVNADLMKYLESIHAYLEHQLDEMKKQTGLLQKISDDLEGK